jgi:uncharacterized membrane protein YgcG
MKRTIVTIAVLAVILLVAIPAEGAPSLQKGNQASYDLSASISFLQFCNPGVSTSGNMIVCPMIATIPSTVDINGTLGWTVTDLNSTTASLNVTRDLTVSHGDASTLVTHTSRSFAESINLPTRIATLLPLITPEIDQAIQMAQTNTAIGIPAGANWTSSASILRTVMHRPLYTMWWVNGPLKLNQTVPVLFLQTNVTEASSVDLGGALGSRPTWTLAYSLSRPLIFPDPLAASTSSIPVSDGLEINLTFNYDQASDLLLTANADIHFGFGEETVIPPSPCTSSTAIACPANPSPTIMLREFGIDIEAALKLVSTSVDLTHPVTQTSPPQNGNSGTGSSTGSGSSTGTGSGSDTGSGGSSGTGDAGATSGTGQHTSNTGQPKSSSLSAVSLPWFYGLIGIVAAEIVGGGVWVARRRMKKAASKTPATQSSV